MNLAFEGQELFGRPKFWHYSCSYTYLYARAHTHNVNVYLISKATVTLFSELE